MTQNKFLTLLIIILIIAAGIYLFYLEYNRYKVSTGEVNSFEQCFKAGYAISGNHPRLCKVPDEKSSIGYDLFIEDIGNASKKEDLIRVNEPGPNPEIISPLIIKGEARGSWFFEAVFPIQIYDDNNNLLGSTQAQAQSDWMTQDFVPFTAEINFSNPTVETGYFKTGTLVLKKDNPSGLPQNDDQLIIPVIFIFQKTETTTVKVYFNNNKLDPEISCNKVFPVDRIIPKTLGIARAALEELLKGPTEEEKAKGFFTSINPGVKIQSLSINDGLAKIDFDPQLEFQVGGSCRVSAIRAQITQTLKQFPTVNEVLISINGRTEDILQP